ncbi:MAG: RdgB/HAM1 family non-canonical purine NTP pyrophosphatase [Bacteroidales bacterium]
MTKTIVFATNNRHKLEEVQHLLTGEYLVQGLNDLGFNDDIPEPYGTLEENAAAKAAFIYDRFKIPCFADDTGLEVDALDGKPGVLSARYAGEDKDPAANMEKLLRELGTNDNRKARFRTVIAYVADTENKLFEGTVEGSILREKRGNMGFGYDPLFLPDGHSLSFAEMKLDEKNQLSHRARAMAEFIRFLRHAV